MRVVHPPISRQPSRTCRRKDRLPKSFEDERDGCESRLRRVHTAQQLFQLRNDATLFIEGRERYLMRPNLVKINARSIALIQLICKRNEVFCIEVIVKVL